MKYLILSSLFLVGCGTKTTKINVRPPEFIIKNALIHCEKPEEADAWMELTEHHHFSCSGDSRGNHWCYGWVIHAFVTCQVKGLGIQTFKPDMFVSAGNSSLDVKENE